MDSEKKLDNVIRFPAENLPKFGFERVKKRSGSESRLERRGQLNLFSRPTGEVVPLPTGMSLFDQALLLDEQDDRQAADAYRRAIREGDSVADAHCNLGVMHTRKGRREDAFECFTSALKHDPQHFESHYNVGNLYFENGELRPAHLHYEIAAKLEPDFPNVYFNLGVVNAMSEQFQAAFDALARYKELAPADEGHKADELLAGLRRSLDKHS